jgi:hypothetical protein
MAQISDADVREMLERRAAEFTMPSALPETILRRSRRRKGAKLVFASAAALLAVGLAGLAMDLLSGGTRDRSGPARATSRELRLLDYSVLPPRQARDHARVHQGQEITIHDLRTHVRCMRSHGFHVPNPTRRPGGRWSVIVHDPRAHGLDFRSRRFREAEFVSCGLLGGPFSGDMVIGGPREKIERFISCMKAEGFNLPEPKKAIGSHHDAAEWRFDLRRTSVNTASRSWNRAMFVTCAPGQV